MCTSSVAIATPFLLLIYAFHAVQEHFCQKFCAAIRPKCFTVIEKPVRCVVKDHDAQIAAMFGIATQASNCGEWTPWGPCIWIKGNNPRWHRSYFDQLLPGRTGCREHIFFKLLRDRWGVAFNNFYNYLREITISDEQCGQCSYQQSCGRECHRRGSLDAVNLLFVAERICADVVQSTACVSKYVDGCRHWPNPNIPLPNVTKPMLDIVNNIEYLNCVRQKRADGDVCRCCCFPFAPNPTTFQCELKTVVVKPPLPPI